MEEYNLNIELTHEEQEMLDIALEEYDDHENGYDDDYDKDEW